MSESRLRIKFGEHEFQAEGSAESVERQLEIFKKLVVPEAEPKPAMEPMPEPVKEAPAPLSLEKIMHVDGAIVSLNVTPKVEEAVLLLLLGHSQFRQHHILSGTDVMSGLRASGFKVRRADLILKRLSGEGSIIAIGRYRTLRYQLSKSGFDRGEQIACQLISQVQ
ncbi:MAG TPA: hypothetical protein VE422_13990 [Terriglobia bacterium]|nr:hypothetical protein [Terriglobia bacterium]